MNAPETINIEKYAEALNELIGVDSAYMVGDKSVDAILELIVAAKKLEKTTKEQKEEISKLKKSNRNWRRKAQRLRAGIKELSEVTK